MIYTYECPKCGKLDEVSRKISERDNLHKCPKCKKPMRRIIDVTTVIYNAGGFYAKDNPKK